jgi:hypothetical protein
VSGTHYTGYVEKVKQLKRVGDLDAAESLLLKLIEATESEAREAGSGVAPWYYEQLAIVYRKKKDLASELAVLERYAEQQKAPGARPDKLADRLQKVRVMVAKSVPS